MMLISSIKSCKRVSGFCLLGISGDSIQLLLHRWNFKPTGNCWSYGGYAGIDLQFISFPGIAYPIGSIVHLKTNIDFIHVGNPGCLQVGGILQQPQRAGWVRVAGAENSWYINGIHIDI